MYFIPRVFQTHNIPLWIYETLAACMYCTKLLVCRWMRDTSLSGSTVNQGPEKRKEGKERRKKESGRDADTPDT